MFTITVGIKGTFDIATARNLIRTQLAANRNISLWMTVRVTVALTALGELIICMRPTTSIPVKFRLTQDGDQYYLKYSCSIPKLSTESDSFRRYQVNLERVSDNFEMLTRATDLQIEGQVHIKQDAV